MLIVGSVATHTCNRDGGYVLVLGDDDPDDSSVMELSRTCAVSGWSGEEITCQCKLCVHACVRACDCIVWLYACMKVSTASELRS